MLPEEYDRYESPELIEWKKLSVGEQNKIVSNFNDEFEDSVKIIHVKNQSIKVELSVSKEERYSLLVKYETYLREKLNNIPIIILLQEKIDANKRRK